MNRHDCETEKLSSRTIGLMILPLAVALGLLGFLVLPVVGLFFSLPLFILAIVFMVAPESKTCKFLLRRDA